LGENISKKRVFIDWYRTVKCNSQAQLDGANTGTLTGWFGEPSVRADAKGRFMTDWPELALKAHRRAGKYSYVFEILKRLEVNTLCLKPLFVKIDNIFNKTITTPNALDRQGDLSESDNTIKHRFWIQFFESLAYAAKTNSLSNERDISKERTNYAKALQTAIKQADNLAKNEKILIKYDKRSLDFDFDGDEYDPLQWIITALEKRKKGFR
jgi:hypothetical protein